VVKRVKKVGGMGVKITDTDRHPTEDSKTRGPFFNQSNEGKKKKPTRKKREGGGEGN